MYAIAGQDQKSTAKFFDFRELDTVYKYPRTGKPLFADLHTALTYFRDVNQARVAIASARITDECPEETLLYTFGCGQEPVWRSSRQFSNSTVIKAIGHDTRGMMLDVFGREWCAPYPENSPPSEVFYEATRIIEMTVSKVPGEAVFKDITDTWKKKHLTQA